MDRYDRVKTLFGSDFEKISNAKIIIFGVGGVGSVALECWHRSGIANITIVDRDRFDITNQNRQLGSEAVGALKVEHLSNLHKGATPIVANVDAAWIEEFDFSSYDLVLDCIDSIQAKIALAHNVSHKLITSGGSAKKIDPTQIRVGSIWDACSDKFVKKFKTELKKSGFSGDFTLIYSNEPQKCKEMGSFMGVTGSFGLFMASVAVKKLLTKNFS